MLLFQKITGIQRLSNCRDLHGLYCHCTAFVNFGAFTWTWDEANNLLHPRHQEGARYQPSEFISHCQLCAKRLTQPSLCRWMTIISFSMGHSKNLLLREEILCRSPFLSTEINLILPCFSLYGRFLKDTLAERQQLKFSFCFYGSI